MTTRSRDPGDRQEVTTGFQHRGSGRPRRRIGRDLSWVVHNLQSGLAMLRHLGYVAIALSIDAPTNRTCRLRNATPERLRTLIAENLDNLARVLEYNVALDVSLYRISSDVVPFASHPINRLAWWEEFQAPLARLGAYIRRHGLRVSMHPGQFTVLNSLNPGVAEAARAEVRWHARFLDALGVDTTAKVIVHIGGMVDGREAAMARFVEAAGRLPHEVRRRLIIENDERLFTAEDVLAVSQRTGLPVVFDWLHHCANPGGARTPREVRTLIAACFATWRPADGIPKIHLSSQARRGRLGQHGEWVRPRDLQNFLAVAPPVAFDCMLEAKRKDQALVRLRRQMERLGIREMGRRRSLAAVRVRGEGRRDCRPPGDGASGHYPWGATDSARPSIRGRSSFHSLPSSFTSLL